MYRSLDYPNANSALPLNYVDMSTHSVVYPEPDELCQEGAGESCLDQQTVPHTALVQTLPNDLAGKIEVLQFDCGWALTGMIGMHLEQEAAN